ncbi:hypothetical protein GF312_14875 [Candidatus Poribacteria bacterium]|nr:hypothetical protein [Candidatus Poribacteria bacterium]
MKTASYISFLFLLLFISSNVFTDELQPLQVLYGDGESIGLIRVVEHQESNYVFLDEIAKIFSATKKTEPLFKRITITINGKKILLTLNQYRLQVDNEDFVLSNPPISISDKAAVPFDFLTDILPIILGKKISLDKENWELNISSIPFVRENEEASDSQDIPEIVSESYRVIIDPGHGGYDVGARSKAGTLEKDLNLEIALNMKEILSQYENIYAYLTHKEDVYMTSSERINFANKLKGHIYISIHFNSSPSEKQSGFRTYVNSTRMWMGKGLDLEADIFSRPKQSDNSKNSAKLFLPQSKKLAEYITSNLENIHLTGEPYKETFLTSMNKLTMPAVSVEILYLSNPQDLIIISRPDFINTVSNALVQAVIDFKSSSEVATEFGMR